MQGLPKQNAPGRRRVNALRAARRNDRSRDQLRGPAHSAWRRRLFQQYRKTCAATRAGRASRFAAMLARVTSSRISHISVVTSVFSDEMDPEGRRSILGLNDARVPARCARFGPRAGRSAPAQTIALFRRRDAMAGSGRHRWKQEVACRERMKGRGDVAQEAAASAAGRSLYRPARLVRPRRSVRKT